MTDGRSTPHGGETPSEFPGELVGEEEFGSMWLIRTYRMTIDWACPQPGEGQQQGAGQ